jgi:glycopeptide antibiotics resistance protein
VKWRRFVSYYGQMQGLARVGAATVAALIAALLGGCIGFFLAWILVEYIRLVEGPPAAVLLVLSVMSLALFGGVLGFLFFVPLASHAAE